MAFGVLMAVLAAIWLAWVAQSWLSAWQMRIFLGRFIHKKQSGLSLHTPHAAVIIPFKGVDLDLPKAIATLCNQNYPDYELVLVVDDRNDPAVTVLEQELARHPQARWRILVAGPAGPDEGQKIHNMIFAIDHLLARGTPPPEAPPEPAPEDSPEALPEAAAQVGRQVVSEVASQGVAAASSGTLKPPVIWAFADSDAVPGPNWLIDMVRGLYRSDVGMTTGYRWLEPDPRHGGVFWSSVASVINSSAIGFMRKQSYCRAWGGSMAIKAAMAIQGDLRGHLVGALCDDYQFTRMVRGMGKRIFFVRSCLVLTPVAFDWPSLLNFAHRQYLLTRVYAPDLFAMVGLVVGLYVIAQVTAWVALVALLVRDPAAWQFWGVPALAIGLVMLGNHVRAGWRRRVAIEALGPEAVGRLRWPLWLDRWATGLWMSVHGVFLLRALCGRTMRWRGIYYRLWAPQRVERLNRS